MTRTLLNLIVVAFCVAALPSCGGKTKFNPTGPTDTYDPSKPIDDNNRPPGPGPTVKATVTYDVAGLQPTGDTGFCGPHLTRCETYVLKEWTVYTLGLCVTHPGVPGRKIRMYLSALGHDGPRTSELEFDEGDPSRQGMACITTTFNSGSSDKSGSIRFVETGQDLIDRDEEQVLWVSIRFRVLK